MNFLRNLLPGNFERYLQGIDFPSGKQELLRKLEYNGAPAVLLGSRHDLQRQSDPGPQPRAS
jgi:hypothetical protein